jgi:isopentenyl phosphate kinase
MLAIMRTAVTEIRYKAGSEDPKVQTCFKKPTTALLPPTSRAKHTMALEKDEDEESFVVTLIKIGGSSITNKAVLEELNPVALDWFARTLATASKTIHQTNKQQRFVVVHGAGSFGHFTAKEYGLQGRDGPPPLASGDEDAVDHLTVEADDEKKKKPSICWSGVPDTANDDATKRDGDQDARRRVYRMKGLSATRLSVQKLNHAVVAALIQHGLPAIGISPCFGIPDVQAHGGGDTARAYLQRAVWTAVRAGLVPVLHGDAGLWGPDDVGILSGDFVMVMLGTAPWITRAIFLTDVDGIYTSDPHRRNDNDGENNKTATLIPTLHVDTKTGELLHPSVVNAQASRHSHDVTGGLKVGMHSVVLC